jgi:hypothetical protein
MSGVKPAVKITLLPRAVDARSDAVLEDVPPPPAVPLSLADVVGGAPVLSPGTVEEVPSAVVSASKQDAVDCGSDEEDAALVPSPPLLVSALKRERGDGDEGEELCADSPPPATLLADEEVPAAAPLAMEDVAWTDQPQLSRNKRENAFEGVADAPQPGKQRKVAKSKAVVNPKAQKALYGVCRPCVFCFANSRP